VTADAATIVYENAIIRVSEMRVGDIDKFATVHHPGAVAIVAHDDEVVYLTRQFRPAVGQQVLELPAGTREPDEDADKTATRELEEEIGKHPRDLELMLGFYSSPGFTDELVLIFRGWNLIDVPRPPADDSDQIEVVHWPLDQLDKAVTQAKTAKTVCGLLLLKERLIYG
jgi:8-oxo-dGTP pyrophosphatase MutT (NUDIX family)